MLTVHPDANDRLRRDYSRPVSWAGAFPAGQKYPTAINQL